MKNVIYQLILFLYTTNQDDVYALAARNILKHIDEAINCSITELAELCYVSPATISRLCRKLSYDSYAEFKNALQDYNTNNYTNRYYPGFQDDVNNNKDLKDSFQNHYLSVQRTIKETYEGINIEDIFKTCKLIHDCNRIFFIGFHTAQFSSIQFQEKLIFLGKDCYGSLNTNEQISLIKDANENDLIILGSLTGGIIHSKPNIIRFFKHANAHKVLLSHDRTLVSYADVFIDTLGQEDSLISKFNMTYIYELLEMVYTTLYGEDKII